MLSLGLVIAPYVPAPGAQSIFYLFFADDCLVVNRTTIRSAAGLKLILEDYCGACGASE